MNGRFIETCTTATKIVQHGALEYCRDFVNQTGRSLLSWEVVLHHNLDGATCAACGGPFKTPRPGCGTAVWIEMRPDGDQLYHSEASGARECRPADIPIWWHVLKSPDDDESGQLQLNLLEFDEEP